MGIEHDILQLLHGHPGETVPAADIAAQLGKEATVIEGYLDRLEAKGEVQLARKYGGCDAVITPLGVVRVYEGSANEPRVAAGEVRARLQEQLDKVEELIRRGSSATLDDIKDWFLWTLTVIERGFGHDSEQVRLFKGIGPGPSLWSGDRADAERYAQQRLLEWRRLLQTWIREIDEFETPKDVAKQYIPPQSQFDAYVLLKDTVKQAVGSLILFDPYVDHSTLQPLLAVNPKVNIRVLTVNPSVDFAHALRRFREQWKGTMEARVGPKNLHDRFLLVDGRVFHSGASLKDLGQRGSVLKELHDEADKAAIRRDVDESWDAAQAI